MTDSLTVAPKDYVVRFRLVAKPTEIIETRIAAGAPLKDDFGVKHYWRERGKHRRIKATRFEIWSLFNDSQLKWRRDQLIGSGEYEPGCNVIDRTWADLPVIDWFERQMIDVEIVSL